MFFTVPCNTRMVANDTSCWAIPIDLAVLRKPTTGRYRILINKIEASLSITPPPTNPSPQKKKKPPPQRLPCILSATIAVYRIQYTFAPYIAIKRYFIIYQIISIYLSNYFYLFIKLFLFIYQIISIYFSNYFYLFIKLFLLHNQIISVYLSNYFYFKEKYMATFYSLYIINLQLLAFLFSCVFDNGFPSYIRDIQ